MSERPNNPLDITAVILAGGMSRRLGRNKALEPFQGETLIRRVIRRMSQVASNIVVVANDHERVAELDLPDGVTPVIDEYPGKGSLGGIYTGLRAAPTEWAIFCACDMPFPSPGLYRALLSNRDSHDAVVPVVDGRPEPIHAAYSRACLEPIRAQNRRRPAEDLRLLRRRISPLLHRGPRARHRPRPSQLLQYQHSARFGKKPIK